MAEYKNADINAEGGCLKKVVPNEDNPNYELEGGAKKKTKEIIEDFADKKKTSKKKASTKKTSKKKTSKKKTSKGKHKKVGRPKKSK